MKDVPASELPEYSRSARNSWTPAAQFAVRGDTLHGVGEPYCQVVPCTARDVASVRA